ncbi:hypothetical protein PDE_04743 [Penicillium oxalicum 114-2]|uniref:Uncharacterized protein n=1 Tax=Penicillium oxalicum (strain 114-2 / CGMCC 5302) TaxID=933388 RepID=S8AUH3_PENO1|nr:hypothetical protein PDE_04743 [Penicillium oxalicum 114-2]
MTTTPPPSSPSSLRIPSAPLHGAGYDQYEPYPRRQSTRLASQRAARELEKASEESCPKSPSKSRSQCVPKKYRRVQDEASSDSQESEHGLSRKRSDAPKQQPSIPFSNHGASVDPFTSPQRQPTSAAWSRVEAPQGLLTPVKTPSKRKSHGNLSSTSRALFPPSGRTFTKKPSPFSLESFETSSSDEIQIFTDSRDRVPVARPASDNPFTSRLSDVSKSRDTSKRAEQTKDTSIEAVEATGSSGPSRTRGGKSARLAMMSGDEEAISTRREGITMMFRGKKVFTRFDDVEEDDDEDDDLGLFASRPDLLEANPDILTQVKPLSRRTMKPRALFSTATKAVSQRDEEAATDDEIAEENDAKKPPVIEISSTVTDQAPVSPESPHAPSATRLLRSSARFAPETEQTSSSGSATDSKRKRISPFDNWLRKKQAIEEVSASVPSAKREADHSGDLITPPTAKKTRSTRGGASANPSV